MKRGRLSHERRELAEAALNGIREYLRSTRGCATFGTQTVVSLVPGEVSIVQVEAKLPNTHGYQTFFELVVKAPQS